MNSLLTRTAILTACLVLSGCVFSDSTEKPGRLTKEDAQNIPNPGEDLCDLYNWYGDGQCDTFCENPDPDCNVQCAAIPVCPGGTEQVEACSPQAECSEHTMCGTTIICESFSACLNNDSSLPPQQDCELGYEVVETCDPDARDCYILGSYCGGPELFCQALPNCEAYPSCPLDTYEVETCFDGDQDCFDTTLCGTTIHCTPQVSNCDAYPVCPDGMTEVDVCQDDRPCPTATLCGYTISCQEIGECKEPIACPQGYYLIAECPANTNCYEELICDTTVSCMEGTIDCLVPPMCPTGQVEVPVCHPNRPCNIIIECGMRLLCQDLIF